MEKAWSSDLSTIKVGDWICTCRAGWVIVVDRQSHTSTGCPIITEYGHTYTINGTEHQGDRVPTAFSEPPAWLIDIVGHSPCEFKKGDRVLVSDSDGAWLRRYFSHVGYNKEYYCFSNGQDGWTSDGSVSPWRNCKKW